MKASTATPAPGWAREVAEIPLRDGTVRDALTVTRALKLGFTVNEVRRLREYFRAEHRDPTDVELAGIAQSWSEHCSYKSSRATLQRAFRNLRPPRRVLGTGDAGVMRFGDGYAYALRIESHNHPSAIEPYGGAATGIGGILRDVLAVGAQPIALADPLFFGPLDLDARSVPPGVRSPRYLMSGVVGGIRDYGNRVGVPTVSGMVGFDAAYVVNPLVNVGCVGFLPRAKLVRNRAGAPGDRLVLVGGLTGRDGIGGVAFASEVLTERSEDESRGAVQLGNPIMKEPLIHACLEAFDRGLVQGAKDLGGGGLATASGELANAAGLGTRIALDRVPLRESGLKPWQIWISESQERMLLDVRPKDVAPLKRIFARHDVPATVVGEVVRGGFEEVRFERGLAARLRLSFRIEVPPLPRPQKARRRHPARDPPSPPTEDLATLFRELVLAPDSVSRESIVRVYDHEVQGRTVVKPLHGRVESPSHGDAAVLRPRPESWSGLAVTVAAQPAACREDPARGAESVVDEAARNLFAVGATPDALSDCLNFGNPQDPFLMGDFAATARGLAVGARALGFAIPSGNVSFYNEGLGTSIPPTPVVLAVGTIPDVRRAVTSDLKVPGDPLYALGRTPVELGGSLWARVRGFRDLAVPVPTPRETRALGDRLVMAARRGLVRAAHDVSDGGLSVTLAEMAFGGHLGVDLDLAKEGRLDPGLQLAAEGTSRWVVEVPIEKSPEFLRLFRGRAPRPLGHVLEDSVARIRSDRRAPMEIDLDGLYSRWRAGVGIP